MQSEIHIFPRANREIQRVHLVRLDAWSKLNFLTPTPSEQAFHCFHKIYHQFLVPTSPWMFGNLVMFHLPDEVKLPEKLLCKYEGKIANPLTIATLTLRRGVRIFGKNVSFRTNDAKQVWQVLQSHNCVRMIRGNLPITTIIPVGNQAGFLTESEGSLKVNTSFFIMDPIDCATAFDHIGTAFGLMVKDGVVESPPLFSRESLLVKADGSVCIECTDLKKLRIRIGNEVFTHGENAIVYSRPEHARTAPTNGLVIIGRRVIAICNGRTRVPASGFILCPKGDFHATPGDLVIYEGMEDIHFGIQVGNSIIRDGVKTTDFISKFYNIRALDPIAYPPSLYPLDFENARAARMALGADSDGKPMLLWAEGMAKLGHIPGVDSCGASLTEMANICAQLGMQNAVNLDGGGSAQILLNGQRSLMISDRHAEDFSEAERPVPAGLVIQ